MIGVDGQYLFIFTLADKDDFIQEDALETFLLVEEAGNVLPTFELIFTTKDEKILRYINEGNKLKVSFGRSKDDLLDGEFSISSSIVSRQGSSKYRITLKGLYAALPYVAVGRKTIYSGLSGIEVINQIAGTYFTRDFSINSSSDSQNWVQHNIPDKKFVNDVWMHSYIPNSFIGVGISSDGRFILKDMKALVSQDSKFRFTTKVSSDKDIYYDGDYFVQSSSGFVNHWLGYGRQKHVYNIEDGTESDILENSQTLLALSRTLSRTSSISKRIAEAGLLSDNVHGNYWKAFLTNLQYLALFSSCQLSLSFHNRFEGIKVLDLVMFNEEELEQDQATEHYSGKYFVSKVARSISNRQFATTIQLCRESFGNTQGELR